MGFNLKNAREISAKTFTKSFDVSDELGSGQIVLTVKFISRAQIEQVEHELRDVAEKDRTRTITEAIRHRIINNLTAEPEGLDDFPTDSRTLQARADEYFAQAAKETSALDDACFSIWSDFKEISRLKPANKSVSLNLSGNGASQNGASEAVQ